MKRAIGTIAHDHRFFAAWALDRPALRIDRSHPRRARSSHPAERCQLSVQNIEHPAHHLGIPFFALRDRVQILFQFLRVVHANE